MARRVVLSDDFTGVESDDVKAHIVMVDNVYYEGDFGADSFAKLEKALAEFLKVMRETRRISATSKPEASQAERIRQWAVANGLEVSERGRLSADVIEAYEKANANGSAAISQTATNPDESDSGEKAPESTPEATPEAPESTPESTPETPSTRSRSKNQ